MSEKLADAYSEALARIKELEADREADRVRLQEWITKSTRHSIRADALEHMLSQVLKTHAAFLTALREAERLLGPEETP